MTSTGSAGHAVSIVKQQKRRIEILVRMVRVQDKADAAGEIEAMNVFIASR